MSVIMRILMMSERLLELNSLESCEMPRKAVRAGSEVAARFQPRIKWISESVAVAFGDRVEPEDLRQEAVILVLSHAGIAADGITTSFPPRSISSAAMRPG
jgi:hypothetical protein